jgi:hypothetical protein
MMGIGRGNRQRLQHHQHHLRPQPLQHKSLTSYPARVLDPPRRNLSKGKEDIAVWIRKCRFINEWKEEYRTGRVI